MSTCAAGVRQEGAVVDWLARTCAGSEAEAETEVGAKAALWMQMAALTPKLVLHLLALMLLTPRAQ